MHIRSILNKEDSGFHNYVTMDNPYTHLVKCVEKNGMTLIYTMSNWKEITETEFYLLKEKIGEITYANTGTVSTSPTAGGGF